MIARLEARLRKENSDEKVLKDQLDKVRQQYVHAHAATGRVRARPCSVVLTRKLRSSGTSPSPRPR
jgi:hypothetical protein